MRDFYSNYPATPCPPLKIVLVFLFFYFFIFVRFYTKGRYPVITYSFHSI